MEGNYWEMYKFAKDLSFVYPIEHPKRVQLEAELNKLLPRINTLKENLEHGKDK